MLRFLLVAVLVFAVCNVVAIRTLWRVHPRRRRIVVALAILGNAMWLFMPMLRVRSDLARALRATLGPPWFAWAAFVLVYSTFVLLLMLVRVPLKWPSRLLLGTTAAALVAGVWTALVPLRVEHVPVAIADLPPQLDGYRIALLSDLHTGLYSRPSRLRTIFATAAAQRPNVVVLAGDNVDDDPVFAPKLLDATTALDARTPLVAVLGNHEMYGAPEEFIARLRGSRIRLLVNDGVDVGGVWIAGISDFAARTPALQPDVDAALRRRPASAFPLLVAHQPKVFPEAMRRTLPLTLCGHTHGGQLAFRPLHWSLAGVFLPYHMGLYRRGASQLYVNTGTGYWLFPWRFGIGISPELTIIELRRAR